MKRKKKLKKKDLKERERESKQAMEGNEGGHNRIFECGTGRGLCQKGGAEQLPNLIHGYYI